MDWLIRLTSGGSLTLLGLGFLTWYGVGMGYIYQVLGFQNDISAYGNKMGMYIGVAILGSVALSIALILLSIQWTSIQSSAWLIIGVSTIALVCSVCAMAIAAATH
jgi:hypothetical protein